MQSTYDAEIDLLCVRLSQEPADRERELAPGVTAQLDASGGIVALEILDAGRRLGRAAVRRLPPPE